MKVVALVPIKFESQRLKNKNFLDLGGKPLCWHIFNTLLQVKEIDEIYVYCSNPKIKDFVPNDIRFLERPKTLDTDQTLGMDIYQSFAKEITADVYVLCHATSPFIKSSSIQEGVQKIVEENHDSAFSVEKHKTFAWYNNKPLNYTLNHIPRTQDLEPVFLENSAFFIFKRDILLKQKRRIGDKAHKVNTTQWESIDIDDKEDFEMAQIVYDFLNK